MSDLVGNSGVAHFFLEPTQDLYGRRGMEAYMILRLPRTPNLDVNATLSVKRREGELWL